MDTAREPQFLLFENHLCLTEAPASQLAPLLLTRFADEQRGTLLVFDADTGTQLDLDLSLDQRTIAQQLGELSVPRAAAVDPEPAAQSEPVRRGPGRPKLGVVSREVTLLPRHWAWLNDQPGGASVSLRKLVEKARKAGAEKDQMRKAQECTYRFINTLAGNLSGFEEACRALYAADAAGFAAQTQDWPSDVRKHARRLATAAFEAT